MNPDLIQQAKSYDMLTLASRYCNLKRIASTNGGEWSSPCPVCGGRDRFRVQPNNKDGGIWLCRACTNGKWKDSIAFQMHVTGQTFTEAIESLTGNKPMPEAKPKAQALPVEDLPPSEAWQRRANELIIFAWRALWEGHHAPITWQHKNPDTGEIENKQMDSIDYLLSRGLAEQTIKAARLGYIPKDIYDKPEAWGIKSSDEIKSIWIPQGILMPGIIDGAIWYLKVKRAEVKHEDDPKYPQIKGSKSKALYRAEHLINKDIAIFCEGEFDALLLDQELQSAAGVVTLGASTNDLNVKSWGKYLLSIKNTLIAYDMDTAGNKGAEKLEWLPDARRVIIPRLLPYDKDLTDFHKSGGDLAALIQTYINTK